MKGKRPKTDAPKPKTKLPPAPEWLPKFAREEWTRIVAELADMGADPTGMEYSALCGYCSAFAKMRQASVTLSKDGDCICDARGELKRHPAATNLNSALVQMRSYMVELGLTPSSRGKIPLNKEKDKPSSPLDKL